MDDPTEEPEVALVDLTGVTLSELRTLATSPFAQALRRVDHESGDDGDVVAGYSSRV